MRVFSGEWLIWDAAKDAFLLNLFQFLDDGGFFLETSIKSEDKLGEGASADHVTGFAADESSGTADTVKGEFLLFFRQDRDIDEGSGLIRKHTDSGDSDKTTDARIVKATSDDVADCSFDIRGEDFDSSVHDCSCWTVRVRLLGGKEEEAVGGSFRLERVREK